MAIATVTNSEELDELHRQNLAVYLYNLALDVAENQVDRMVIKETGETPCILLWESNAKVFSRIVDIQFRVFNPLEEFRYKRYRGAPSNTREIVLGTFSAADDAVEELERLGLVTTWKRSDYQAWGLTEDGVKAALNAWGNLTDLEKMLIIAITQDPLRCFTESPDDIDD